MKPKSYLFTLGFVFASLASFAQNDNGFISRAINSVRNYSERNPIEKVYLHLDKPFYAAGDDIWFKAYLTAGSRHVLSGISGILYVELINPANAIEQYIKLPVVSGLTWGDFKLPDTLKAGNYRVRAYTNWMRNAGADYFFDQPVKIGNAVFSDNQLSENQKHKQAKKLAKQAESPKPMSEKIDVQFFPESGSLVYGIHSEVAFKAIGDDGLGKAVQGVVLDGQGQEIAKFATQHSGMGEFNMLPLTGKTYRVLIKYPDGSEKSVDLPAPRASGYVLHVDNTDSLTLKVKIEAGGNLVAESGNEGISLIAQSDGVVYYAAKSKSANSAFTAVIPKSKLPWGIVQFTLFSPTGEPLNERLAFIENTGQLNLSLAAQDSDNKTRGKTKIDMAAITNSGKPALGNFSVAVTDETKVVGDEANEGTIFSNLLLTSDIKGYVENPNYYFTNITQQTRNDLDLLMLTQGYHRLVWKQVLAGDAAPVIYQPEQSLQITGRLKTFGGKAVAHGKVSLMSSSKGFFMIDTTTDDQGNFAFKNLQFKDSLKFVVQSKTVKDKKNVVLALDSIAPPPVSTLKTLQGQTTTADTILSAYLANSKKIYDGEIKYGIGSHVKVLKEVVIKAQKPLPNSSNLNGPGNADQVLLAKDLSTACPSIAHCLIGKLTAVFFKYDYEKMIYYPCMYVEGKTVVMKVMVDGFLIDPETLSTIPPSIIESVEVLRRPTTMAIYGPDGNTGLILINTKKGNYTGAASTANIMTIMPKGYYKAREFYSPRYDDPKTNTQMADLRSTIYWNPNVATDKDGKASFEYFNADSKGTYRVVIEGIDGNGNLGRQVYHYTVE